MTKVSYKSNSFLAEKLKDEIIDVGRVSEDNCYWGIIWVLVISLHPPRVILMKARMITYDILISLIGKVAEKEVFIIVGDFYEHATHTAVYYVDQYGSCGLWSGIWKRKAFWSLVQSWTWQWQIALSDKEELLTHTWVCSIKTAGRLLFG